MLKRTGTLAPHADISHEIRVDLDYGSDIKPVTGT